MENIKNWFWGQVESSDNKQGIIETMEYVKTWGLEAEVIEWTKRFYVDGDSFENAIINALYEWDL